MSAGNPTGYKAWLGLIFWLLTNVQLLPTPSRPIEWNLEKGFISPADGLLSLSCVIRRMAGSVHSVNVLRLWYMYTIDDGDIVLVQTVISSTDAELVPGERIRLLDRNVEGRRNAS